MKHLIVLPDGREVSSGAEGNAIVSVSLTQAVNSGAELTPGSCCAAMLEAKLYTPMGGLDIAPGAEISLYTVEGTARRQEGVFLLEQPTRPSANTLKLTGYDRISRLEKDLSQWLSSLTGWPYSLLTFAGMVCEECGLTLVTDSIPNGSYPVEKFTGTVTGRQLLKWCGELACRFVRATPEGNVEFAWYRDKGAQLSAQSEHFYYAKSLSYEAYATAPIDAVQLQTGQSGLFPAAAEGANAFVIAKNPLLSGSLEEDIRPVLEEILEQLRTVSYTPLKVSCPASQGIRAGDILTVTDGNGAELTAYVMTAVRKGTRLTLECTGSKRRSKTLSPTAEAIEKAMDSQTQAQLFHKLTGGGAEQGIYLSDGRIYINASYLKAGVIEGIEIIGEKGTIGGFTLSGNTLSAEYRKDFPEFTQEDLSIITQVFMNWDSYTAEEQTAYLERYDVNMDGRITSSDAVAISSVLSGAVPSYSEGRIILDASNPRKNLRIEVTGGYRAGESVTVGLGGVSASRLSADSFACGDRQGYTGEITLGNTTLTVTGGIITNVT